METRLCPWSQPWIWMPASSSLPVCTLGSSRMKRNGSALPIKVGSFAKPATSILPDSARADRGEVRLLADTTVLSIKRNEEESVCAETLSGKKPRSSSADRSGILCKKDLNSLLSP